LIGHYGLYDYDITTIKKLGHITRVSNLKAVRCSGLECEIHRSKKNTINDSKLENNISRAKTKVKELVLCNEWNYFCTFTISKEKYNRYDFKTYYEKFSKFIGNYNRSCLPDEKVKYIFVPEMHKDGAWHIHGFIKGIRKKDIYINGHGYLGWTQYEEKFGFISFSDIRDIDKSANYILKYITKDTTKNISALGMHIYYASKGLETAEIIYKGKILLKCPWGYETKDGYCRIKEFDGRYQDYKDYIEVMK